MGEKTFPRIPTLNTYINAKANIHTANTNITMKTPTNTNSHVQNEKTSIHTISAYTNVYKYTYHRVYMYNTNMSTYSCNNILVLFTYSYTVINILVYSCMNVLIC